MLEYALKSLVIKFHNHIVLITIFKPVVIPQKNCFLNDVPCAKIGKGKVKNSFKHLPMILHQNEKHCFEWKAVHLPW